MEERITRKSRIYSRFKSLPLLSPEDEQKLNKILRRATLKKKLFKTRTILEDSIFLKNKRLMKHESEATELFEQKDSIQTINIIENNSIFEVLDDSMFSDNSNDFNYSIISLINFESTLEKAKTRVLNQEKTVKKEDLIFMDNKIFLNLLLGEGSIKEIDTYNHRLRILNLSQRKNNYCNQTCTNSAKEDIKTDNTSPSIMHKRIKVIEIRDLQNDTNKLFDLDDKQFIVNGNLEKFPSKIDKIPTPTGDKLKFFHMKKHSLRLINDELKTFSLASESTKNQKRNKFNWNTQSDYKNYYNYLKKTKQNSLEQNDLQMGVISSTIQGKENRHADFNTKSRNKLKLEGKGSPNRSSKQDNLQSSSCIKSPAESSLNMKKNLKYHDNFVDYIRNKNCTLEREDPKEIIRGGRINLFYSLEEEKNNVSKINFALPKSKVEKSVILIQQSWRYYFNLKKFLATKIQTVFRGYYLRNKVNQISYVYFSILNRLKICENIVKTVFLNAAFGKLNEYFEFIKKKIFFKANLLLKRNLYRIYEKKGKRIVKNPIKTIAPLEKIVVENNENSYALNSVKDCNENELVLRNRRVFSTNIINISKKNWIKPCSISKKLNYSISYVIKVQRLIRNFLMKLKKIRSLQIIPKYIVRPFYINKENKYSKINSLIRKIINQYRKFKRINNKIQIIPFVIKKKINFDTSISTLFKTMFTDFSKKKILDDTKFILSRYVKHKFEMKLENLIIDNERKYNFLCFRKIFNLWKENSMKENKKQLIQSKENFCKLIRKKILLNYCKDLCKTAETIRLIDLIFTIEAMVARRVKQTIFKDFVNFNLKKQKFLKTKSIFKELYKEMQLSYLQAMDDYDKIEQEYSRFSELGESLYNFNGYRDDYNEEKMKFKYCKGKIKRTRESDNWWNEYEIKSNDCGSLIDSINL